MKIINANSEVPFEDTNYIEAILDHRGRGRKLEYLGMGTESPDKLDTTAKDYTGATAVARSASDIVQVKASPQLASLCCPHPVTAPATSVPWSATEGKLQGGSYERRPVKNGWHSGQLVCETSSHYRWTNSEDHSWVLQVTARTGPDAAEGVYLDGHRNHFYHVLAWPCGALLQSKR